MVEYVKTSKGKKLEFVIPFETLLYEDNNCAKFQVNTINRSSDKNYFVKSTYSKKNQAR